MKDRGKSIGAGSSSTTTTTANNNYYYDDHVPCTKHASSSSSSVGGVCAYCLKERLVKLVCSDCGEQRLSSCSCSDISSSSYPNSCFLEVGSVGRISLLMHNDTQHPPSNFLKRSSSSSCTSTHVNKGGGGGGRGFWKFRSLFRKKRNKDFGFSVDHEKGNDDDDMDNLGGGIFKSRSRSRSRSIGGGGFDGPRHSYTERPRRGTFIKEFDNSSTGFIDIKFGSPPPPQRVCRDGKSRDSFEDHKYVYSSTNGSSCRVSVDDKEPNKCRKSIKVWRWILKHQSSASGSGGRPSFNKENDEAAS